MAPDAQLITMKVFGKNGGAYDSDYMAAIEDAILLGCDSVNLSLGSSKPRLCAKTTYQDLLDQLSETDVVVPCAAGNAGSWADGVWNGHLYSDAVSLDMVGSPGSYTNALTVASADNVGYTGRYLTVQDGYLLYRNDLCHKLLERTLAGQPREYVLVDGFGLADDFWTGIDLTGKVAVCARGTILLSEKANKAAEAGAGARAHLQQCPRRHQHGFVGVLVRASLCLPHPVRRSVDAGSGQLHTETIEGTIGAKSSPEKSSTTPVN